MENMSRNAAVAVLVALFASAPALAAEKICLVPIAGPVGASVRSQLSGALCDSFECVAPEKVTTGGKPDWKKAKKENVGVMVTGAVSGKPKKQTIALTVLSKAGAGKVSKSFPIEGDQVSQVSLAAAADLVKAAVGAEPAAAPAAAPVAAAPVAQPAPTPAPDATPAPAPAVEPAPAPAPEKSEKNRQSVIAVEVGADILNRSLTYTGVTAGTLRKYTLGAIGLARVGVEFHPLALKQQGALAGLGLEGSFAIATWIKSQKQDATVSYPTSTMKIDGGLLWRIMPLSSLNLGITPFAGIRMHSFKVSAASDGTTLDGTPGIAYTGLRAGLGLDLSLADDRLVIFGKFAVLPMFSSGEIISSAFLTGGSTLGLEAQAGVGVRLAAGFEVRANALFTKYTLTFKSKEGDAYIATGAADQYLGGTVNLRWEH